MTLQERDIIAARAADPRISLLLGIANLFLFLDHIPHNAVSLLTMENFGFSGATDLFVFVGGYALAIASAQLSLERGFLVASTRVLKRVWQLYAAYVVLFVVYVDLIGYVATQYAAPEIIAEFNITGFVDHPIRLLIHGLLLQAKPRNLDLLQLFIALMAFLPVILLGMLRWPDLTMAGSVALYMAAGQLDWNLSSFPEGNWYYNPFCWQLLSALGAWFALNGATQIHSDRSRSYLPFLRGAALLYLLLALTIVIAGKLPNSSQYIPNFLLGILMPDDTGSLTPQRLLHILALALLFTWIIPRNSRGFHTLLLQPVIKCGEEWLAVFCAGIFLSFGAHFVLITGPKSLAMQVLVSAAGFLVMSGIAYYVSWSKRQDYRPVLGNS